MKICCIRVNVVIETNSKKKRLRGLTEGLFSVTRASHCLSKSLIFYTRCPRKQGLPYSTFRKSKINIFLNFSS